MSDLPSITSHCVNKWSLRMNSSRLAPERVERRRELAGDVTAADHCHALRAGFELEKAVGGDAELGARHSRHIRISAGGDHHVRRGEPRAVDLHRVRVQKFCPARDVCDALRRQVARVHRVEARDVRIALFLQGQPVIAARLGGRADREAVVAGVLEGRRDARRVPHYFLRNTADVHAGAAEPPRFDDQQSWRRIRPRAAHRRGRRCRRRC